jgi:plasmid stabilization system protein ParE
MDIVWRRTALDDLEAARQYIAAENPRAAKRIYAAILSAVERLASFPGMGRPGRVDGTRELVVRVRAIWSRTPSWSTAS